MKGTVMARVVGEGRQDFGEMIAENSFYIDKTSFIREWWKSGKDVTLITRLRRFGKILTINMTECICSIVLKISLNLSEIRR